MCKPTCFKPAMNNATFFDIKPLLPALAKHALIITANQRLCNKIKAAWGQHQQQQGLKTWLTPNVITYSSWLTSTWFQLQSQLYANCHQLALMSEDKELWLWQKIINDSELGKSLLLVKAAAEAAKQAYSALQAWQIEDSDPHFTESLQWESYLNWQQAFENECESRRLISASLLPGIMLKAYGDKTLVPDDRLYLVGFDDLSPQQQQLFAQAGEQIQLYEPTTKANSIHSAALPNQEIEITQAANWAKAILERNPDATVGILCPNLPERRKQIERILSAVFEPQSILPDQTRYAAPFNFSAGFSLAEQPVIHHAFEALSLNKFRIPFESALTLLHSPFIITPEAEKQGRIFSELALRKTSLPEFTLSQIKNACEKHNNSPALHQGLVDFSELYRQQTRSSKKLLPEAWGQLFLQQLSALGWPGDRRLDSIEYQQVKQWASALQNLSSYNSLTGKITCSKAIQLLQSLTQNIQFQAQTPDSPVQVLGLLEGASLHFSHLWVLGMDDKTWPAAPRPNPLLPLKLQKICAMPHSSAERELSFAISLMNKITHSAGEIVFSYSSGSGDEIVNPSKLITTYPEYTLEQLKNPEHSLQTALLASKNASSEQITEARAPEASFSVSAEELSAIGGGTGIFKNQALCPFKAFATHRLKARPLNEPTANLNAMDRGTILHLALEYLWKQLKTQKNLLNIAENELQPLISQASAYSLEALSQQRPDIFGPVFKNLETKRLINLIKQWLEVERKREPFAVIAFEQQIKTEYQGIPLKLRIDRIDQTDNGDYHLIDYKTGSVKIKNWLPETFTEPQLPLYALIEINANKPVKSIHYAQVNIKQCRYLGLPTNLVADNNLTAKDIRDNELWQTYLEGWQGQLSQLAKDFIAGKADVAPRPDSNPCRYCELAALCRVNEVSAASMSEQEDAEERAEYVK